ncbi:MAG: MFS transporter, partial [Pseudomonadales bacterium]
MSEAVSPVMGADSVAADTRSSVRLGAVERIGYGVGDFGINLYFISAMTFLLYFYTDVLGLTPAAAGGVLLVARLVDAVTDPIMGLLAERTRTRFGRMRPYIFLGAVPLGVIAVLTFTVPDLDDRGKLIWAYVTYTAFGIAYTVVTIPYSTMTAVLTTDHHERTLLSTVRMACAFAGGFVVSVLMLKLVGWFETPAQGFQGVMIGFAVIATGCLCLTAASTKERIAPPPTQHLSVVDSMRAVFINPPLLVVMVLFTCGMLAFTIRQTVAVYYFEYYLGRGDLIGTFFMVTLSVMLVGLIGVPKLAARLGKGGSIVAGGLLTILGCIGMYYTPQD